MIVTRRLRGAGEVQGQQKKQRGAPVIDAREGRVVAGPGMQGKSWRRSMPRYLPSASRGALGVARGCLPVGSGGP